MWMTTTETNLHLSRSIVLGGDLPIFIYASPKHKQHFSEDIIMVVTSLDAKSEIRQV